MHAHDGEPGIDGALTVGSGGVPRGSAGGNSMHLHLEMPAGIKSSPLDGDVIEHED